MQPSRQQRRALEKANAAFPPYLVRIHPNAWPDNQPPRVIEVWRSRHFLVQVFAEPGNVQRLSICRTSHNGDSWVDQITWDELMKVKRECGCGDRDALEVFPADKDIVNVANMRHLWLPPAPVEFAWRKP
ncbi:hypothetical protein D9M71_662360 [compost metagenome]